MSAGESDDLVARRHQRILDLARQAGSVSVEALALELDVTPQTVRRDLNQLARRDLLARVHGGAVVTSGVDNLDHAARRHVAADAKEAIGVAVAALVPNGASVLLSIGTTTEAMARALTGHRDLLVVTNNLNIVDILADRPSINVIAVGGEVRPSDRAVVGALATEFIRGFKVDLALIGASAVDHDGTLLDFAVEEVRVAQTIIAQSRSVILGVDHTKFGRPAPIRIAGIDAIDHLVTDRLDDDGLRTRCDAAGVRITEVAAARAAPPV